MVYGDNVNPLGKGSAKGHGFNPCAPGKDSVSVPIAIVTDTGADTAIMDR